MKELIFKEISVTDFDLLYGLFSNDDVMRYTIFETFDSKEAFQELFDDILKRNQQPERMDYAYAVFANGDFIGMALLKISLKNAHGGCGEIGYLLMPGFWGQGYATRIARKLLGIGFEQLGLHRICAFCNKMNIVSEKVMKSIGMVKEGELRKKRFKLGAWHNELCYALLKSEWKK